MNQKETITIPLKQYKSLMEISEKYKCLRGHLEKAAEAFKSLGAVGSLKTPKQVPKQAPKETKRQGIDKYKRLIESGERVKKPEHLKK